MGCQKFCVLRSVKQISAQGVGEALAEQNGELVGRLLPGDRWHLPVFLDIPQGQVKQLAGSFVAREMAPVLDDLA